MVDILKLNQPTSLSKFIGNKMTIKKISELIKISPCRILIIGPSGSGKTTLCNLAMNLYNYDVLQVNGGETEDLKGLKRLIDNFANNKTIESYFSNRKKLIFIDDVDILISCDRNANSFLLNFVDSVSKSNHLSFIMSSSTSEEKKLTELKKKLNCIRLSNPSRQDVFAYISCILDKHNIPYNDEKLLKLIEIHNNNIRNTINNLHQMDLDDNNLKIEKQQKLLYDSNVFDVMGKIYNRKMDTSDFKIISDNNLVPLLLYENYLSELFKNRLKQTKETYFNIITDVLDSYIDSDTIEQYMYQNTEWSLCDLVTYLRCGPINWHFNTLEKKKAKSFDKYIFTQLLTKSALRCNYGKKLSILKNNIGVSETETVFYIFDNFAYLLGVQGIKLNQERKRIATILNLDNDDMAAVYQYLSQFLGMDKSLLSKIKKS
jgi:DNA polymerase III delta prime subunit